MSCSVYGRWEVFLCDNDNYWSVNDSRNSSQHMVILSVLEYGSVDWHHHLKHAQSDKLDALQKRAVRTLPSHITIHNCPWISQPDNLSPPASSTSTRHSTCDKIAALRDLSYPTHQNKTILFFHQLCTSKLCIMIVTCFCILHICALHMYFYVFIISHCICSVECVSCVF